MANCPKYTNERCSKAHRIQSIIQSEQLINSYNKSRQVSQIFLFCLSQKQKTIKMYQQKFMPYNQMNDVYEQEQFQQQESQPLIEQVDQDYQPTDKQVKQYAIEVLGMSLPQDQRLMYLAKEGLKAPIPMNWQPFQGRDGQVYYKHKITQEKTFQHPTDVEYRKKYVQEKQTVARKNLKSMSLKGSPLSGIGQPLGHTPLGGLGPKPGFNPLGLSNLSAQSYQALSREASKLDPRIDEELERQVQDLQLKLKRQLQEFQTERQQLHEKNMKRNKSDFESHLSQLKADKSSSSSQFEKSLKQQRQRTKQRLKQAYDDRFKDQFLQVQKQHQKRYLQFVQLYEQDNKINLRKYQTQKKQQFNDRLERQQKDMVRHQQNKKQKQKEREKLISQLRTKLQQQNNQEIQQATRQTFEKQLKAIKQTNDQKVRGVELKLENQFTQMKRLLGHDPNQLLQEMAQKKNRLKKISQQKLESIKKKQYQKVSLAYSQQLSKQTRELESQLQSQSHKQLQSHKQATEAKLKALKTQFQEQRNQNLTKRIQQLYSSLKRSTNKYQKDKNQKILQIRDKFICQIVERNELKTQEIKIKMSLKDKEQMIENKQELVESLSRQVQVQRLLLKDLQMNKRIIASNDIDGELKKLMAQLNITYKPKQFLKHQEIFNQLRRKYKADKQLLASMMNHLQNNSFVPYYQRYSQGDHQPNTQATSALVKRYNQEVRTMRKNEEMLSKYQLTLRKAELNDQRALKQLLTQAFHYEDITLKTDIGGGMATFTNQPKLNQIQNLQNLSAQRKTLYNTTNTFQSVQDTLKQHSKFLSNVKAELNRKLYKVRSNNFYRV